MTFSLAAASVRGLLLDVEGTTTPIEFVYDVLFPFVRQRIGDYLRENYGSEELRSDLNRLREEHRADLDRAGRADEDPPPPPQSIDSVVAYVHWLMDRDRKSTGLKSLQGRIWREGYLNGSLRGRLFHDFAPALRDWHEWGIDVRIFSSGSVLAQKLLFSHSEAGDLTAYLDGYFDTAVGPKTSEESYRRIAAEFGLHPRAIAFLSDVTVELDASRGAGMQTLLCVRPGNRPAGVGHGHPLIQTFAEIVR